jgi:hypothetical protein
MISDFTSTSMQRVKLKIPFSAWETTAKILRNGKVITKQYLKTGVIIEAEVPRALVDSLKPYFK